MVVCRLSDLRGGVGLLGVVGDPSVRLRAVGANPVAKPVADGVDYDLSAVLPAASEGQQLEPFFASAYFDQIYEFAERLILKGKA